MAYQTSENQRKQTTPHIIIGQLTGQSMVAKARRELSYFSYS
jgi:hypothetical protein